MTDKKVIDVGEQLKIDLAAKEYAKNSGGDFNRNYVAFQKGAAYATAAKKEDAVGMKWQKCSERLPETSGYYFVKMFNGAKTGLWFNEASKIFKNEMDSFADYELEAWLDESPPPAEPLDEGKEIAIDWDMIEKEFMGFLNTRNFTTKMDEFAGRRNISIEDIFNWFKNELNKQLTK